MRPIHSSGLRRFLDRFIKYFCAGFLNHLAPIFRWSVIGGRKGEVSIEIGVGVSHKNLSDQNNKWNSDDPEVPI